MPAEATTEYGRDPRRGDVRPKIHPARLVLGWIVGTVSILLAAGILPGLEIGDFSQALGVALLIAVLNGILPPLIAALRLPYTVALAFLLVLAANAAMLLIADAVTENAIEVGGFWSALVASVVISAVSTALEAILGTNDDDAYSLRVVHRVARKSGEQVRTEVPGILYLEIDGLSKPVLQRAMRDGNAPQMAQWLADDTASARRVGDRPLLADRRESGGHPARLEREHPRLPLGRQGARGADGVLEPRRLRRDRAPALVGRRARRPRRLEPRQPALRGRATTSC